MTLNHEPHEVLGVSRFAPWADVRAAYLTLVRRYHPDGSMNPDGARMAAVNVAYETLERRRLTADGQAPLVPMGPGPAASGWRTSPAPDDGSLWSRVKAQRHAESPVLDFGQYAGWRIADVAPHARACRPRQVELGRNATDSCRWVHSGTDPRNWPA